MRSMLAPPRLAPLLLHYYGLHLHGSHWLPPLLLHYYGSHLHGSHLYYYTTTARTSTARTGSHLHGSHLYYYITTARTARTSTTTLLRLAPPRFHSLHLYYYTTPASTSSTTTACTSSTTTARTSTARTGLHLYYGSHLQYYHLTPAIFSFLQNQFTHTSTTHFLTSP